MEEKGKFSLHASLAAERVGLRRKAIPWKKGWRGGKKRSGAPRVFGYEDKIGPAFKRLIEATPLGMAHWIATGPSSSVCGECRYYGYGAHPNRCYRYYELYFDHGNAFPAETPSCMYFVPRRPGRDEIFEGDKVNGS
jgi:hypothetical protein